MRFNFFAGKQRDWGEQSCSHCPWQLRQIWTTIEPLFKVLLYFSSLFQSFHLFFTLFLYYSPFPLPHLTLYFRYSFFLFLFLSLPLLPLTSPIIFLLFLSLLFRCPLLLTLPCTLSLFLYSDISYSQVPHVSSLYPLKRYSCFAILLPLDPRLLPSSPFNPFPPTSPTIPPLSLFPHLLPCTQVPISLHPPPLHMT
jgi:hypothetical protein